MYSHCHPKLSKFQWTTFIFYLFSVFYPFALFLCTLIPVPSSSKHKWNSPLLSKHKQPKPNNVVWCVLSHSIPSPLNIRNFSHPEILSKTIPQRPPKAFPFIYLYLISANVGNLFARCRRLHFSGGQRVLEIEIKWFYSPLLRSLLVGRTRVITVWFSCFHPFIGAILVKGCDSYCAAIFGHIYCGTSAIALCL